MKTTNTLRGIARAILLAAALPALPHQACKAAEPVTIILQGKISLLNMVDGNLDISGVSVAMTNAAVLGETGLAMQQAELKVGDRVTINATPDAQGKLVAEHIRKTLRDDDALQGRNERTDATGRTLTVAGIAVKVPLNARIEDAEARAVPLEQCSTNGILSCSGSWSGPREFTATSVTLR